MNTLAILLLSAITANPLLVNGPYPDINSSLETVIQHFPSGLAELKGEVISKKGQVTEYRSKVNISGASPAVITEQQLLGRKILTWKCVLASGVNGDAMHDEYEKVFNQLNNVIIKSGAEKPFILSGKFREPILTKAASSHFTLLPSTGDLKDIKVDLVLDKNGRQYSLYIVVSK